MSNNLRCAIYTRKSTDEGLEQAFNSLEAQREACEAFIKSQRGLGWIALAAQYDDGGWSGGTMDRPALRTLLADIESHKVDLVVVYKVDRLTRSLTDFARMVERFDACGVSFVSVTQQFNTTTSMGRLTLNVLLSFAQFEREVTGERIRDKIAASKKKGMWMGGLAPLGYDIRDRKLIINPVEAEIVRTLFRLYRELGTVNRLVIEASRLGLVTKERQRPNGGVTGGQPLSRGHLYQLLANPIYAGQIAHKGELYPGQHEALIDPETFDAVRRQLEGNAVKRQNATNVKAPSLLAGLVYDEAGDRLCPTHANKNGCRYRYYISKRLMHQTGTADGGWRVPAKELETVILQCIENFLRDEARLFEALQITGTAPDRLRTLLDRAGAVAAELSERPESCRALLLRLLSRVTLGSKGIRLTITRSGLSDEIMGSRTNAEGLINIDVPALLKRRGVEARLIIGATTNNPLDADGGLIELIAKARRWFELMARGELDTVRAIAAQAGTDESDVARLLPIAFLAPDIVEAIIAGRQPTGLTVTRLTRIGSLPLAWDRQRRLLGFDA